MSSGSGGVSVAGNRSRNRIFGADRFYNPPPLRKYRPKQEQEQHRKHNLSQTRSSAASENKPLSSDGSISSRHTSSISNLDRFLQYITPVVSAQFFPKTSMRRWKTREAELHPYFVLGDLWESFKEWSAYGAGVPLVLNGGDSVTQYYNVSLSAIQLYIDPSRPSPVLRGHGEESDSESARETSSDSSIGYGHEIGAKNVLHGSWNQPIITDAGNHGLEGVSSRSKPLMDSSRSSDERESCHTPDQLLFEYFEHETPYNREPLSDKISDLARQFPELKTYRSCDLSPSSWVSLAWYPIYRIPTGPTLQGLSSCFLTFHSLSTSLQEVGTCHPRYHYQSLGLPFTNSKFLSGILIAFMNVRKPVLCCEQLTTGSDHCEFTILITTTSCPIFRIGDDNVVPTGNEQLHLSQKALFSRKEVGLVLFSERKLHRSPVNSFCFF